MELVSKMIIHFLLLLVSVHGYAATVHFSRRLVGYTFLNQTDVSLVRCRRECSSRVACQSINYRRITHTCELNQGRSGTYVSLETSPGYIYENISAACTCNSMERCNHNGSCVPDRCASLQSLDRLITQVSGNMNSVGARTKLSWSATAVQFHYRSTPLRLACAEKGYWVIETLPINKQIGTCTRLFRGDSGSGGDLYRTWSTGVQSTDEQRCVVYGACPGLHYRHSAIYDWQNLNMKTLRFSVYMHGSEVQYVVFNGTGSTAIDWFSHSRVLESSWTSLLSLQSPLYFSIQGIVETSLLRRFYMAYSHNGCAGDSVWFSASTRSSAEGCSWDGPILSDPPTLVTMPFSLTTEPESFGNSANVEYANFITITACF